MVELDLLAGRRPIARRANLLLLDKPTNHVSLDVPSSSKRLRPTFLAPSRDRRAVEDFENQIYELRGGKRVRHVEAPSPD
jgi:macrolide transport system ATP-binding/permease protein